MRIPYGSEPLQFGDLRLPHGDGPCPLAVVIHGGAWKANFNLTYMGHLCVTLARIGIATWNVEFRRVGDPGGGWPNTLDDVLQAVEYVDKLPIQPSGSVLIGHSSGGHLALLAAAQLEIPVVAIAAASDFSQWQSSGLAAFLGDADPAEASPRNRLPLKVRQVLAHGRLDDQVPFSVSEGYVEAAIAEGDPAELLALDEDGHFEPIDPGAASWPQVEAAIQRLSKPDPSSSDEGTQTGDGDS